MGRETVEKKVHAPYNFVPFSAKIIERYKDTEELPPYGKIDPDLKTGEIYVTLETQTPLYISNGKEKEEDFFRGADGKYQIPGSTIRGMLRENIQMLGFGLIRPGEDIADYQIYFRDMTSSSGSVKSDVKDYYKSALDIETKKAGKKSVSIPKNVKAGYLHNEEGKFYIIPTRYIRVSRKNPGMYAFMKNGEVEAAVYKEVGYIEGENIVKEIVPLSNKKAGMKEGILISTGKPVGQKNHLYVLEKECAQNDVVSVEKEDIISYCEDFENRKNSLKAYYDDLNFWEIPENGETKPVFYIQHNGHVYFGMSLFLRIGYPHSISEGLPDSHKRRIKDEDEQETPFLDYPYAMLGFARDHAAYRSRVSVGDFHVAEKRTSNNKYSVIGAEPKPSYYAGYIKDGKSYVEDSFSLRGYKQYWMRENIVQPPEIKNKNMGKQIHPVEKKTLFKGIIRFRNLHEDELGLLLWALQLEDNCYQSIGLGKPYGFGRVKVTIEELTELKPSEFYSFKGLTGGLKNRNSSIEEYIKKYKKYAAEKLEAKKKKKIDDYEEIKDFFFIHKVSPLPEKEMAYMELKEYGNETEILKSLREYRKEQEEKNTKKTENLDMSNPDWLAALNKKFK